MGQMDGAGVLLSSAQQGLQCRQGQLGHVDRAQQQALIRVVLHQPGQCQQWAFVGRWFGQGGVAQGLRHFQVLAVAAQQGHGCIQPGQQAQRALQPGATFRVCQQGFVSAHAAALPTAQQAAAQRQQDAAVW